MPRPGQCHACDARIQIVCRTSKRCGRHAFRQLDQAVLNRTVLGNEDRQCLARVEADELDLFQPFDLGVREHHAGAAGKPRECFPGFAENGFEVPRAASSDLRFDPRFFFTGKVANLQQRIDEQA